jgi:hypothetical protein
LKVKIINKDGIETAINPESILVGGLALSEILKRLVTLENKVNAKFGALEKHDAKIKEAVRKL